MAMASLQLSPIPLPPARNGCPERRPRMAAVRCKYNQSTSVQGTRLRTHITRRDTLSFMSSAVLIALLAAGPAEARTSRLENKKKAMEKLEKTREKALGPRGEVGGSGTLPCRLRRIYWSLLQWLRPPYERHFVDVPFTLTAMPI